MNQNPPILKKEIKPKVMIGVARTYDHAMLLSFLEKKGISLANFARDFNIHTRRAFLADAPAGMIASELAFRNITPTVGFEALTKALSGNISSVEEVEVMVHAFGTDGTAPALGDTTLGNETVRKLISSKSYSGASAFYTAFYDVSEAVGTFAEMGLFANADDGTPDDGTLWDRSLEAITKLGTQTLTIDYEDSFVNNE